MPRANSPADVFRHIDTKGNDPEPCWPWTSYAGDRDGRGYMALDGKRRLAYHIVWEIFNGPIPKGQVVRHKCDNPLCCNPKHLELGTQGDNEKDKYVRDRWGYPADMILEIKRLHKLHMSLRMIAQRVGTKFECEVSHTGVSKVIKRLEKEGKIND